MVYFFLLDIYVVITLISCFIRIITLISCFISIITLISVIRY